MSIDCRGRLAEAEDGTFNRHMTQGMMKYRGSTSGAVTNDKLVVTRKIQRKDVVGPPNLLLVGCTLPVDALGAIGTVSTDG